MAKKRKMETIGSTPTRIPWDQVFLFLDGLDMVQAFRTSQHCSPWRHGASGNDEQKIVHMMKTRLGNQEAGKKYLRQYQHKYPYENRPSPHALAKLLVKCNSRIRHDGVYRLGLGVVTRLYRFYPSGEVITIDGSISAREFWTCFTPTKRGYSGGTYFYVGERDPTESKNQQEFCMKLDVVKFGRVRGESLTGYVRASDGVLSIDSCPSWETFCNTDSDEYEFIPQED